MDTRYRRVTNEQAMTLTCRMCDAVIGLRCSNGQKILPRTHRWRREDYVKAQEA
jgi:hypothetical protein